MPDLPCLSKMPFVLPDVLQIVVLWAEGSSGVPLVGAWAAAFNGDPASLARDNIVMKMPERSRTSCVPPLHSLFVPKSFFIMD